MDKVEVEEVDEFKMPYDFGQPNVINSTVLRIDNGFFGYDSTNYILENIDFSLSMESWVALLGKNGCGKTTLINILLEHV